MGTTPTYSWPYPDDTDPVANGAQDIEDLALAVESTVSGLKIAQVVQDTAQTAFTTTSTSFVDVTGLSVTITPSATSSKVLILASAGADISAANYLIATLYRGGAASGTNLGDASEGFGGLFNSTALRGRLSLNYLDSPSTTSATTYTLAVRVNAGSTTVMAGNSLATIIALEVLG